jgi:hypothetical protein
MPKYGIEKYNTIKYYSKNNFLKNVILNNNDLKKYYANCYYKTLNYKDYRVDFFAFVKQNYITKWSVRIYCNNDIEEFLKHEKFETILNNVLIYKCNKSDDIILIEKDGIIDVYKENENASYKSYEWLENKIFNIIDKVVKNYDDSLITEEDYNYFNNNKISDELNKLEDDNFFFDCFKNIKNLI